MTEGTPNVTPADPRIIGFWKGIGGDYGLINEFRSDGILIQHVGDRTTRPAPYRIEGDHVVTVLEQPDGSISEDRTQYAISGDTLTFFYSPRKKMRSQRTN